LTGTVSEGFGAVNGAAGHSVPAGTLRAMDATAAGRPWESPRPAEPQRVAHKPPFRIWDALVVFLAGQLVGGTIGFTIGYGLTGDEIGEPGALTLALGFAGQFLTYGAVIWLFCRVRGTGSLRRDLGLVLHWRDWWAIPLGTGCAIGLGLLVLPLRYFIDETQTVVDDLNDSSGAKLAVICIAAGLLAPVFEELLFRGLFLRALLGRVSEPWAIGISATAFGAVHFLGGNALGTLAVLPALIGLGAISGVFAVRSGDLSRSVLLHMGFNLLAVTGALLA
jgi:membrane protease YdiL (CAAX protease family)